MCELDYKATSDTDNNPEKLSLHSHNNCVQNVHIFVHIDVHVALIHKFVHKMYTTLCYIY